MNKDKVTDLVLRRDILAFLMDHLDENQVSFDIYKNEHTKRSWNKLVKRYYDRTS